jgi:hypothetical protein
MKLGLLLIACAASVAAQVPSITYTKEFRGSQPPYFSIEVAKSGDLTYKESPTDNQPVTAHMKDAAVSVLFDMAGKLNDFRSPLESGLKVANTGKKTFRYDDGSGKISETTFNYSTNQTAQQLLEKFELIGETERAYLDLERTSRFDKLGVNDSLAEVESLWLRKQLAAPSQFIPLLNRVASHESYMHLARDRAARLRDEIQAAGGIAKAAPAADK